MARIGFIGVGFMGHGMARNLLDKGHDLTLLGHRNRAPVDDLLGRGAREAASPRELAAASEIVFLCLPNSAVVEATVRGPDGLAAGAAPGLVIVDTTTANPNSTKALAAELAGRGVTFVDAPLGRTPKEAAAGTLDVMVGADPDTFARLEPVIRCFAARVLHIGPVGAGHTMKLLNNFLSMGYASIYAEALALGAKVGIAPETFDGVIRGGRMDCGFYQTFMRWVLERDENAHLFSITNAHKDMRYLADLANAAGVSNWVGTAVKNYFASADANGRGERYVPMIADWVARLNGVERAG